ncbi:MAG: substrate-binding domain-containing protein [Planctomycetota bacterium]|jgi:LacI family repressor for deo operon, udp, cdd, tsx, nupC, and nupG
MPGLTVLFGKKHTQYLNGLLDSGMKVVTVLGHEEDCRCRYIDIDNTAGAEKVVEFLVGKGHQRIAHIGNFNKQSVGWKRLQGYKNILQRHKYFDEALCVDIQTQPHKAYSQMKKIMEMENPPSAVFVWNDISAVNAQRAVWEAGADIEVAGFDDMNFIQYLEHPFLTVHLPLHEAGVKAVEMVLGINTSNHAVIEPYVKEYEEL